MKCDEEGATQNMMGAAVLVCRNGQWEYDSTATAEANKCDEEGATKTETMSMMGMDIDMTYKCENGQWTMDMSGMGGGNWGGFGDSSWAGGDWGGFGDSSWTGGNWNMGDSSSFGSGFFDWGGQGGMGGQTPTAE